METINTSLKVHFVQQKMDKVIPVSDKLWSKSINSDVVNTTNRN